mmetsp:Transcript_48296/g.138894  ORF Transcript_48296/g.138894 Transcript_48296/m.138894 type:complete len:270 (+) Transcript_48296:53-862(+)
MGPLRLTLAALLLGARFVPSGGALHEPRSEEAAADDACLLQLVSDSPAYRVADPLVYVLTVDTAIGRTRYAMLAATVGQMGITSLQKVEGVSIAHYPSEEALQASPLAVMSEEQKRFWETTPHRSNGALACAIGHSHIWRLAREALSKPGAPKWAVILEDDAKVNTTMSLNDALAKVSNEADLAFFDGRFCRFYRPGLIGAGLPRSWGSTAYAVTARGAAALLAEPIFLPSDEWLNVPIREGKVKGFCGDVIFFEHPGGKSERFDYVGE